MNTILLTPESLEQDLRAFRTSIWAHIRNARTLVILSVPLIYALAIPFALLDLCVTIYQAICFPIYGIPKVRRRDYLIFDRGRLPYLNAIEKVGCIYCSYANGLLAYIAEIAGRTEQHFCPIKHSQPLMQPHSRYGFFLAYGDARSYREQSGEVSRSYGDLAQGGSAKSPKTAKCARMLKNLSREKWRITCTMAITQAK